MLGHRVDLLCRRKCALSRKNTYFLNCDHSCYMHEQFELSSVLCTNEDVRAERGTKQVVAIAMADVYSALCS